MSIPTGYYTDLTKNYFGIDPASTNQDEVETAALLWSEFLSKVSAEESPYFYIIGGTDETKIKDSILNIISSYVSSSGLSQETINQYAADLAHELATRRNTTDLANLMSTDPLQIATLFSTLLSSYISPLPSIFTSLAEELATMNADTQKQKIYLEFLSQKLQTTYESEAVNSLSPTETQNRYLSYTLFEILITLIDIASKSQTLEATAVDILVNKEKNYTDLLKKAFLYVGSGKMASIGILGVPLEGGGDSVSSEDDWYYTETKPNSDPSLFNLGYGDITLQDVFDYLAKNTLSLAKPTDPSIEVASTSFTLKSGKYKSDSDICQSACTITVTKNFTTNTLSISTTFNNGVVDSTTPTWTESSQQSLPSSVFDLTSAELSTKITDALSTTFYDVYNQAKTAGLVEVGSELTQRTYNLMIPWGAFKGSAYYGSRIGAGPGGDDWYGTMASAQFSTASSARASQNKTLNTYIQNIKSKKDIVSDTRDSQSQVVDACLSSKKQQLNLVQGIIRQLKNIISSIYK